MNEWNNKLKQRINAGSALKEINEKQWSGQHLTKWRSPYE